MEKLKFLYQKFNELDRKKKSYIIVIIAIVLVMLWAFIYAGVVTSKFNRSQIKNSENEQKVDASGIIITETKDGQKYFEIYGETGHYSNDRSVATLHNVIGNFYKDNQVGMSFQSMKGSYNEKTGVVKLFGNTFIVLENGTSLNADKVTWLGNGKSTVAEGHVLVKKNNEMIATAEKGIINKDYDKFKIIGKTTTKIFDKKAQNKKVVNKKR